MSFRAGEVAMAGFMAGLGGVGLGAMLALVALPFGIAAARTRRHAWVMAAVVILTVAVVAFALGERGRQDGVPWVAVAGRYGGGNAEDIGSISGGQAWGLLLRTVAADLAIGVVIGAVIGAASSRR